MKIFNEKCKNAKKNGNLSARARPERRTERLRKRRERRGITPPPRGNDRGGAAPSPAEISLLVLVTAPSAWAYVPVSNQFRA
ncbi:hypothetical protein EVAR_7825_1 [Eumeta japonica]|uniref:Uncharacterized protein n=1 Tax=Eumeta variegata TaxID=151549 RepID=A0A4C1TUY1_EUMVA|nr:hypothetical protein EVAR_7825_1 [Eumeta japonica]